MISRAARHDSQPSPPISAETLLTDSDPPPLSEVLVQHAERSGTGGTGGLEAALQARPWPDVYEPLAGPASESPD